MKSLFKFQVLLLLVLSVVFSPSFVAAQGAKVYQVESSAEEVCSQHFELDKVRLFLRNQGDDITSQGQTVAFEVEALNNGEKLVIGADLYITVTPISDNKDPSKGKTISSRFVTAEGLSLVPEEVSLTSFSWIVPEYLQSGVYEVSASLVLDKQTELADSRMVSKTVINIDGNERPSIVSISGPANIEVSTSAKQVSPIIYSVKNNSSKAVTIPILARSYPNEWSLATSSLIQAVSTIVTVPANASKNIPITLADGYLTPRVIKVQAGVPGAPMIQTSVTNPDVLAPAKIVVAGATDFPFKKGGKNEVYSCIKNIPDNAKNYRVKYSILDESNKVIESSDVSLEGNGAAVLSKSSFPSLGGIENFKLKTDLYRGQVQLDSLEISYLCKDLGGSSVCEKKKIDPNLIYLGISIVFVLGVLIGGIILIRRNNRKAAGKTKKKILFSLLFILSIAPSVTHADFDWRAATEALLYDYAYTIDAVYGVGGLTSGFAKTSYSVNHSLSPAQTVGGTEADAGLRSSYNAKYVRMSIPILFSAYIINPNVSVTGLSTDWVTTDPDGTHKWADTYDLLSDPVNTYRIPIGTKIGFKMKLTHGYVDGDGNRNYIEWDAYKKTPSEPGFVDSWPYTIYGIGRSLGSLPSTPALLGCSTDQRILSGSGAGYHISDAYYVDWMVSNGQYPPNPGWSNHPNYNYDQNCWAGTMNFSGGYSYLNYNTFYGNNSMYGDYAILGSYSSETGRGEDFFRNIAMRIEDPVMTLTNMSPNFSCTALQSDGTMECTAVSVGTTTPNFVIPQINGRFYGTSGYTNRTLGKTYGNVSGPTNLIVGGRVVGYGNTPDPAPMTVANLAETNNPSDLSKLGWWGTDVYGSGATLSDGQPGFILPARTVPAAKFVIYAANQAPAAPTVVTEVQGSTGKYFTFKATGTDPDHGGTNSAGKLIGYQADWDNSGSADVTFTGPSYYYNASSTYVRNAYTGCPTNGYGYCTGYVYSGTPLLTSNLWTETGSTTFRMRTIDDLGLTSPWTSVIVNVPEPFPSPQNILAETSSECGGKVKVSWDPVSGADQYRVYRYNYDSGEYDLVSSTTATSSTDTLPVDYYDTYGSGIYNVTAYDSVEGESILDPFNSQYADPSPQCTTGPDTPTNFDTVPNQACGGNIRFSWTASPGATGYKIYKFGYDPVSGTDKYNFLASTTNTYYATTTTYGAWDQYRITSYNTDGESNPSGSIWGMATIVCSVCSNSLCEWDETEQSCPADCQTAAECSDGLDNNNNGLFDWNGSVYGIDFADTEFCTDEFDDLEGDPGCVRGSINKLDGEQFTFYSTSLASSSTGCEAYQKNLICDGGQWKDSGGAVDNGLVYTYPVCRINASVIER